MLVLSRNVGEQIVIRAGDEVIVVTLSSVRGQRVRLGFEAPDTVLVHRREVADAIARDGCRQSDPRPANGQDRRQRLFMAK